MNGARATWSPLFLPKAGADPSRLEPEPELAPGPWPSGAAQKSGGSATLLAPAINNFFTGFILKISVKKYLKVYLNFAFPKEMCPKLASLTVLYPGESKISFILELFQKKKNVALYK